MLAPTSSTGNAHSSASNSVAQTVPALASDFETFLKMLTAQARYQDPLEPIDSSEYAAQLAQFSMVEQQVQSNDLLKALTAQLGGASMAQTASWIGMEALSSAPVRFDGTPITINPNPVAAADEVVLVVFDDQNNELQRLQLPVSADPVLWAGTQGDGTPFANGVYRFEIESRAAGEILVTDKAQVYSRITEARIQDGETALIMDSGHAISANEVTGIREAA